MAGISTKTVHDIFQNMEYGSSSTSFATAQVKYFLLSGLKNSSYILS